MFTKVTRTLILVLGAVGAMQAEVVTLFDTIPSNPLSLFPQPPLLTGAAPVFGGTPTVGSSPFTPSVSADLDQISVVVRYEDLPVFGVTGMSPMLLTLSAGPGNSPGPTIESWIVPPGPPGASPIVTVDSTTSPLLLAGLQYWVSVVPTDPADTGIGWGITASGSTTEFSVSGTTAAPEPATFWFCGLIFFSLLITRARGGWRCSAATSNRAS
jgi:hypothetical protein